MTRPLFLTAAFGFVAAVVCFAIVAALGPIDWENFAFTDHVHAFHTGHRHGWSAPVSGDGPQTSRDIVWGESERLGVDVPGEVTYTQGPVAHMTVTGPQGMVQHLEVEHGVISFDAPVEGGEGLKIALTAPSVHRFSVDGSGKLTIADYDQDSLHLSVAGSGDVTAKGKARAVELSIAGSGDVDMGGLAVSAAKVSIAGSGDATIAPKDRASVSIAGSGDVTVISQTAKVTSAAFGSGHVIQVSPSVAPTTPAAPTSPAAPAAPAAKKV